jgi:hypothetical protein
MLSDEMLSRGFPVSCHFKTKDALLRNMAGHHSEGAVVPLSILFFRNFLFVALFLTLSLFIKEFSKLLHVLEKHKDRETFMSSSS